MSDDLSKVDWGRPIEAVSLATGVAYPASWSLPKGGGRLIESGGESFFAHDMAQLGWRIRNVTEPADPLPSDIAAQMVALVDLVSNLEFPLGTAGRQAVEEARAIRAKLDPVDADLVEARKQAAEDAFNFFKDTGLAEEYLSGDMDDSASIRLALAAIRRGRALERDSREG